MTLFTNLEHVETATQHAEILENNENVMICCGRMGPMCVPVYAAMEELKEEYPNAIDHKGRLLRDLINK